MPLEPGRCLRYGVNVATLKETANDVIDNYQLMWVNLTFHPFMSMWHSLESMRAEGSENGVR